MLVVFIFLSSQAHQKGKTIHPFHVCLLCWSIEPHSKSHKLWVEVLSGPDVPHPDCLGDPCLPDLILTASIAKVSTGFHQSMMMW